MQVEDAISLLPQIPETQRDEVWTYWQVISVAVKAAVGGRGPIVAKRTKTRATRGRPRGRPRLYGRHREVLSPGNDLASKADLRDEVIEMAIGKGGDEIENPDIVDTKEKFELQPPIQPSAPQDGTATSVTADAHCSEGSAHQEIPQISNPTASSKQQHSHVLATFAVPTSSEVPSVTLTAGEVSAAMQVDGEIVTTVSRGVGSSSGPQVHIVSVPVGTSAGAPISQQTAVKTAASESSDADAVDVTSATASASAPPPSQTLVQSPLRASPIVKRRRGRPPKSTTAISLQTLPACALETARQGGMSEAMPSEGGSESESKTAVDSEFGANGSAPAGGVMQNDLQSIITALELEERKSKDSSSTVKAPPPSKVRRSERRIAPNRDNLFCYFDQTQREESEEGVEGVEEEEGGGSAAVSLAEKLIADVKQESKEARVKSEDEKMEERTCHVCFAVLMSASSMAGTDNDKYIIYSYSEVTLTDFRHLMHSAKKKKRRALIGARNAL